MSTSPCRRTLDTSSLSGMEIKRKSSILLEHLEPGVHYVYQPDPQNPSGRVDALIPEQV